MVEPSKELQLVFDKAIKDATKLQHEYVTLEHLLFAMMCSDNFFTLIKGFGADVDYIKSNLEHFLKNNLADKEKIFKKENSFKGKIGIFDIENNKINHRLNFYEISNGELKEIF